MVSVADLSGFSFARDLMHSDIIITVNSIKFGCKVVALHSEAISVELHVSNSCSVRVIILVYMLKFVVNLMKLIIDNLTFSI